MPRPASPAARRVATPVDWDAVRARLEHAAQATAAAAPDAGTVRAVLEARAARLRRPAGQAAPLAGASAIMVFELAGQRFGLEAHLVKETLLPRELTRLPGLPDHIRGVVNVRSRIVAAVDLRPVLQLPPADSAGDGKLLIAAWEDAEFGILADAILGLAAADDAVRRDVPGLDDKYLQGIAADGTIILSLPALVPDLVVDDLPLA